MRSHCDSAVFPIFYSALGRSAIPGRHVIQSGGKERFSCRACHGCGEREAVMPVSEKLAIEILTIMLFHLFSVLFLTAISTYVWCKAKHSSYLYSFLALVGTLLIWMVSKMLKTVAPTETSRWIFIVSQYVGVQFLGFCLILFGLLHTGRPLPSRRVLTLMAIPPVMGFMAVLTNPLHMGFYSHFDFYRDRFGPLFLPIQTIQYGYIVVGVIILSRGFTLQPAFRARRMLALIFSGLVLLPLGVNIYYITFKLTDVSWVFPFSVFDVTPVAGTVSLMLFVVPALKYRFLEISGISHDHVFRMTPHPMAFLDGNEWLHSGNMAFQALLPDSAGRLTLARFLEQMELVSEAGVETTRESLVKMLDQGGSFVVHAGRHYSLSLTNAQKGQRLLVMTDITDLWHLTTEMSLRREELMQTHLRLVDHAERLRELAATRARTQLAQQMHDLLGHTLTVLIGKAELAALDVHAPSFEQRLEQLDELLLNSLSDWTNAMRGDDAYVVRNSLIEAVSLLDGAGIGVEVVAQGTARSLPKDLEEAVYGLCREAVTNAIRHGGGDKIDVIIRYRKDSLEVHAIDNGRGCRRIHRGMGLHGMEQRVQALGGKVAFGSDGQRGFHIHAVLPYQKTDVVPALLMPAEAVLSPGFI